MELNGWAEYVLNGAIVLFAIVSILALLRLLLAWVFPKDTR